MNRAHLSRIALILLLLVACAGATTPAASPPSKPRPSLTLPSSYTQTPSFTPSAGSSLTPTDAQTQVSSIQKACIPIEEQSVENQSMGGTLLMLGGAFFDLSTKEMMPPGKSPLGYPNDLTTSPDGRWLAYTEALSDEFGRDEIRRLQLVGSGWEQQPLSYWTVEWQYIVGWIDNQRIALTIPGRPVGAITILNPFTGDWNELKPSFPNLTDLYPPWSPRKIILYNPTLTHVAVKYVNPVPRKGSGHILTLWDVEEGRALWSAPSTEVAGWSQDGKHLAANIVENGTQELVIIDLYGNATQVTNLAGARTPVYKIIEQFSWSPDGRYIAAWLKEDEHDRDSVLALINVENQQTFDLCIRGNYEPIWSPEGGKFAILSLKRRGISISDWRVLIVDIQNWTSFSVLDEWNIPIGWLWINPN